MARAATRHEVPPAPAPRTRVGFVALAVAVTLAAFVILAWAAGRDDLTAIGDGRPAATPVVAVSVLVLGTALGMLLRGRGGRSVPLLATVAGVLAAGAGFFSGWPQDPAAWWHVTASSAFGVIALALATAIRATSRRAWSNAAAIVVITGAYFAVLGQMVGVEQGDGLVVAGAPPVLTTIALGAGAKALLAINGGGMLTRLAEARPVVASLLRVVLFTVQLLLPVLAVLLYQGVRTGWWTAPLAFVIFGLAAAAILVFAMERAVRQLDRSLVERDAALSELAEMNAHLTSKVRARTAESDDLLAEMAVINTELRASEERSRILSELSPVGIYRRDHTGAIVYANQAWQDVFGLYGDDALGHGWRAAVDTTALQTIRRERSSGGPIPFHEVAIQRPDGETRHVRSSATRILDDDGNPLGEIGTAEDITDRVLESRQLAAALRENELLIDLSGVATSLVDRDGTVVRVNPSLCRLLRTTEERILGTRMRDWVHRSHAEQATAQADSILYREQERIETTLLMQRDDGTTVWVDVTAVAMHERGSDEAKTVIQLIDVDVRHRHEQRLNQLATTDHLTGLANRFAFEAALDEFLAAGGTGSVLLADLDHFKRINDTLGHGAGDSVITETATILRQGIRSTDLAARLGGDEFAVLLRHTDAIGAAAVAANLVAAIPEGTADLSGTGRGITASIGMATFVDGDATTESLMIAADTAMYDAKDRGRSTWRPHSNQDGDEGVIVELAHAERIERALDEDRLELFAQPIRRADGSIELLELLLRLRDDDGQIRAPGELLHAAQRYGLIGEVDRWVVARTCALASEISDSGQAGVALACNISASSLSSPWIVAHLAAHLEANHVAPGGMVIEVTETEAISHRDAARENARRIVDLGVRLAMDDFGAGHMSFGNLRDLPVELVKIDGRFVRGATRNDVDRAIVGSAVHLGHLLGARVVAEHVEDLRSAELLVEAGIDLLQGFALGEPVPVDVAMRELDDAISLNVA